jgi:putative ABC transport system permease protein
MKTIFKIIYEGIAQALSQLRGNKMRSFLSLMGISIGIFSIIGVLSAVDSLEDNVRGSLEKLGNDVIYIKKWPWADVSDEWWTYLKRPNPSHEDFEVVKARTKSAQLASFHVVIGFKTIKYQSSSVDRCVLIGTSLDFEKMFKLEFESGRFFSPSEYYYGSNKILLGFEVAEELFGNIDPIGKQVKLSGRKYEVIGVIKKSGKDLLNPLDFDDCLLVSYNNARGLANLKAKQIFDTSVTVKAAQGVTISQLKDEVKGIMRAHHRLKPKERDDFALNELSMISSIFDSFFGVLNMLGIVIGIFAIIVGGVSVANIMFVSVKERTNIIGVKKALGAKRYVILLEFLIEAIILCVIGGLMGLGLVFVTVTILSSVIDFSLFLSFGNVIAGVILSIIVGVVSGLVPAIQASGMDPVVAMRQ